MTLPGEWRLCYRLLFSSEVVVYPLGAMFYRNYQECFVNLFRDKQMFSDIKTLEADILIG